MIAQKNNYIQKYQSKEYVIHRIEGEVEVRVHFAISDKEEENRSASDKVIRECLSLEASVSDSIEIESKKMKKGQIKY